MKRKRLPIFINLPYRMIDSNIGRIAGLSLGIEVYIENNLFDGLSMGDVKEMGAKIEDYGVPCTVHAPFLDLSPGGYDRTIREMSRDKIKKAVEAAQLLKALAIVCHPGYDKWSFAGNEQLWLNNSIETWTDILASADRSLMIMLENIFEETPSTLLALFDHFRDKNLFFCFDSGHFNLFSTIPLEGWLVPLKDRIREMHLHDNHGKSDEHLPIGRGDFPFRELKAFLGGMLGEIIFTSEFHDEAHAMESIKNIKEFLS